MTIFTPLSDPQPISIWQPQRSAGELIFVRPDPYPLGDHYATQKVLHAAKGPSIRRICFLGESVAAGYLYAPHLTPAGVLQAQLEAVGQPSYEVVDLARVNETLDGLVTTVRQALQLQPDLAVIWVGNNWNLLETPEFSPYIPSTQARQRYGQALRQAGVLGPIEEAARSRLQRSARALAEVDLIARSAALPVILVVPETNLADWENRQPVVWLPGDQTSQWYVLYHEARRQLDNQDWPAAADTARSMIACDGSTCPTSYRILAKAYMGLGDLDRAREAALAEIDSGQYANLCFMSAPQATMMDQALLRQAASRYGFGCVDLPAILAEHTGSPLPGRRLFLDYCHLTVEGIKVSMAAVSSEILQRLEGRDRQANWQAVLAQVPEPIVSPQADAVAKFGAAIHNAHRLLTFGSKASIVEYWCQEALDAYPGIKETMLDFIRARTAPCPVILTAAQQRNLASPYYLTMQHGWRYDYLDVVVIQAVQAVLERAGGSGCSEIRDLVLTRHHIRDQVTDLAIPFYHWEPLERFYPDVMAFADLARRAMVRSPWPVSSFCLVCDATRDVGLDITARLPALTWEKAAPAGVQVGVNGYFIKNIRLGTRWRRWTVRIGRNRLRPGFNQVVLRWPMPHIRGEQALTAACARLEQGLEADLHPVFGEVFALIARPD